MLYITYVLTNIYGVFSWPKKKQHKKHHKTKHALNPILSYFKKGNWGPEEGRDFLAQGLGCQERGLLAITWSSMAGSEEAATGRDYGWKDEPGQGLTEAPPRSWGGPPTSGFCSLGGALLRPTLERAQEVMKGSGQGLRLGSCPWGPGRPLGWMLYPKENQVWGLVPGLPSKGAESEEGHISSHCLAHSRYLESFSGEPFLLPRAFGYL